MWPRRGTDGWHKRKFLLTHPVWDVTPNGWIHQNQLLYFYSHIPCGMWQIVCFTIAKFWRFLLTHPVWDVTWIAERNNMTLINDFYSHIPCGMWPHARIIKERWQNFYSHIPCGMWQHHQNQQNWLRLISTHTSRVGCDSIPESAISEGGDFYSHIPCGMWRCKKLLHMTFNDFYSHIPCGMWRWLSERGAYDNKFLLTHPVWDVTPSNFCFGRN